MYQINDVWMLTSIPSDYVSESGHSFKMFTCTSYWYFRIPVQEQYSQRYNLE